MSAQDIDSIVRVTGLSSAEAAQLLQATGNPEAAINAYFGEGASTHQPHAQPPAQAPRAAPVPVPAAAPTMPAASARPPPAKAAKAAAPTGGARIKTFASMAREEAQDEDKGQEFFAGGGVSVAGPKRKDVFDAARKMGATEKEEATAVKIVFYREGFAVEINGELGPLRGRAPEDQAFMETVKKGFVPDELRSLGENISVALVDKHDEEYKAPKPKPAPSFSGQGMVVGSATPAPETVYTGTPQAYEVACDPSKPTTRLQLRLADGTKLVASFNTTVTLRDIYAFVRFSRPDGRPFVLSGGYPRRDLAADSTTLEAAELTNAVLQQRWA
eukprot:m.115866 g.115866  ORF g.115866 m.115866 type:complete len:330 (-) comp9175_c0_seq3:2527-3516(-)